MFSEKVSGKVLVSLDQIGSENDRIQEVDINPVTIREGKPIAMDALIVLR